MQRSDKRYGPRDTHARAGTAGSLGARALLRSLCSKNTTDSRARVHTVGMLGAPIVQM